MFGSYGSANGQFNQPWASLTTDTRAFILDRYNHRIQVFDLNGTYLRSFGGYGNLEGKFNNPMDMDWDDEGQSSRGRPLQPEISSYNHIRSVRSSVHDSQITSILLVI